MSSACCPLLQPPPPSGHLPQNRRYARRLSIILNADLGEAGGAFFAVIFAWFAILFTAKYPKGLFDYVVGVGRWELRVAAYAFLLVTDKYPPFGLSA